MTDLHERLVAANPVSEMQQPSMAEVWRKVAMLDEQPLSHRQAGRLSRPNGTGRRLLTVAAAVVPVLVVLAVAITLHGARHRHARPTAPTAVGAKPALDRAGQRAAALALAGRAGSVVALDPRTGAIKVMYTNTRARAALSGDAGARVQYRPEALFDVVTAAAALDSGRYTPSSRIGPITLARALSLSVNAVFAKVGERLGRETLTGYMSRFGLPAIHIVDLGRLAAGQSSLVATPLQMAMVAAAVANGGKLMEPHLGITAAKLEDRVMKPSTARALVQMMRAVVAHETGTAADLANLPIAGKTGTGRAGSPPLHLADAWFIGFAPADDPRIAVAVVLHDVKNGYGGTDAAPIAARMLEKLLSEGKP